MVALARGEENTPTGINWYITVNGVLTDAFAVEFQIWDKTAGLPGVQIFPATPGTWEDVTNAPGKFSVGSYYAYDNGNAQGWTPDLAANVGTWCVKWRWKITVAAPYQTGEEEFEVLLQSAGSTTDTYITVQDIRDLGVTDPPTDDDVLAAIQMCQAFIDRACRQWFVPKIAQFKVDGTDSDALHLAIPIVTLEWLKLNNATDELDVSLYRVYDGRGPMPDDRKNPRIKLVRAEAQADIFTAPLSFGRLKFRKGRQNQELRGTFGYTESDGSVPQLIQRAMKKLVIEKLANPIFGTPPITAPPPSGGGVVVEEEVDDHRIKFQVSPLEAEKKGTLGGFTKDQEVLTIIQMYRAPMAIATPAHWGYEA
jgi:hypothetical protein